ncbi:hypothetical protein ND861_03110 [Leptospira sp. 2 VSF19]|uniref:Gluconate 2-dehydrogenase subunit 3 family protein n=1 Tax=Leptospira soteropolitanensis TaxID=2950025 RepID=A0AAW5VC47_9LEPT|nr:hypothetical protein [Leptospira soteropolitanensis]MCW7491636.1 hypothetical protein [Leptospira soteropolitanensis]MCW7499220.1 hypothetical protein [Leptospira soteropolitanensis]MCW7521188.1 hypothetical protein [Leptospira soteropolitanensis]MCW7525324.1 hypothetical protein [Leptospira soteropolitanensis]MCW7529191.1 hypothetical protein [Leptospira soteropolitanensis]
MYSISRKSFLALLLFCAGIKSKIRYFYFSDSETKTVGAFSEVVLPVTEKGMPSLEEANVMRRLDEELYFVSEEIQEDFHSAVMVLEYLPIFYGHFSFFSNLSREKREELLSLWAETDSDIVRAVVGNLKLLVCLVYYGHKSTWEQISYPGPFANPPEKWSEARIHYQNLVNGKEI